MSVVLSQPPSSPKSGRHHNSHGNGVIVDFENLTNQNEISEFIKEHNQDLRFPEKVCTRRMSHLAIFQSLHVCRPHFCHVLFRDSRS